MDAENTNWKDHGIRVVRAGELDSNTPQTPGMSRAAAITYARTGATKLWAGTVVVQPDAKTGPHHHGELETVLYIVKGRARMRWGDHLEFRDEVDPGDFLRASSGDQCTAGRAVRGSCRPQRPRPYSR
jgi:uncharacterized RmlC-like cupin family protein